MKVKSAICDRDKQREGEERSQRHANQLFDTQEKRGRNDLWETWERADGKIGRKPSDDNNICLLRFE